MVTASGLYKNCAQQTTQILLFLTIRVTHLAKFLFPRLRSRTALTNDDDDKLRKIKTFFMSLAWRCKWMK